MSTVLSTFWLSTILVSPSSKCSIQCSSFFLLMISKHEDISLHIASAHWLSIDACIMYKQTCIYFLQLFSPRVSPSSGVAGMVMSIILPLCSVQYVLLLNTKLPISILYACMHMGTCDRAHARKQARTYARTHARSTHERMHVRTYARTHVPTHARTHVCTYQPVCLLCCE